MYIKSFAYGHDWELVSSFLQWWIKSSNFSKDVRIGDNVNRGGKAIRDIDHTIRVTQKGKFELLIEKGAIMSDGPPRELRDGELYLNKRGLLGTSGFDKSVKKIEKWLEQVWDYDPCLMNPQKANMESQRFDMVGTGLFIETCDQIHWKIRIVADVVGIPK